MLVKQILKGKATEGVLTLGRDTTVSDAVQFLSEKRVGAVVISEDGKVPLGILSERDVVRELARRGPGVLQESVTALMTSRLVTCTPADSSDDVMEMMTSGRFRHLPVLEGAEMIGLISIGDVVKARLSQLSMEKDALEGMIKGF